LLLLSIKNHVETHAAWGLARGLVTPPAQTWCLGYASVLGTSQRTRGAWAPASVVFTPLRACGVALLAQCWTHPLRTGGAWVHAPVLGTSLRTHDAWVVYLGAGHTPAHTWCLGTPRPNYPWASHAIELKIVLGHWLCRAQNRLGSWANFLWK